MNRKNNLILLIEDNQICQKVTKRQLELLGYSVEVVDAAKPGIALIKRKVYSVIITDLSLPDLSGEEVIKAVRSSQLSRFTPLIMHTAQETFNEKQYYLELGVDVFLTKPVSSENLKKSIQETIKKYKLKTE
ncbi:response regulator [Rickettsiella massiliensis]|uniref:response regulator n=1 Tax=Rickettsiella massiliensis TaxID=676517 RepID=UPI000299D33F|nr:response regulator [Rickettsiella massiliensis]